MSGRDPSSSEAELFFRNQIHARAALPSQPWEQPSMLCMFDPMKAMFPQGLGVPYQGGRTQPMTALTAGTQSSTSIADTATSHCQAWTRAVKARRGASSRDRQHEAYQKVLLLLQSFASFFDLCTLMEDDTETGQDSLQAILAGKSPATVLKHVGPIRTFCEWLVKSGNLPPFPEKVVWSFVNCVLKLPRTAATTLDTCLKATRGVAASCNRSG